MKENARECFVRHFEINRATDSLLEALENRPDGTTQEILAPNL
jgi:hypothetical protein